MRLAKDYKGNKVCSLKTISQKEAIPFDFLEKIVSKLEKAGLVKSKKGVRGGYFLSKSPEKIKAGEVVEVLEEKIEPVNCFFCGRKKSCPTKNVWKKVQDALVLTLNSVTLDNLINKNGK